MFSLGISTTSPWVVRLAYIVEIAMSPGPILRFAADQKSTHQSTMSDLVHRTQLASWDPIVFNAISNYPQSYHKTFSNSTSFLVLRPQLDWKSSHTNLWKYIYCIKAWIIQGILCLAIFHLHQKYNLIWFTTTTKTVLGSQNPVKKCQDWGKRGGGQAILGNARILRAFCKATPP